MVVGLGRLALLLVAGGREEGERGEKMDGRHTRVPKSAL